MNRPRILIVDDDPSLVRLLQYRLEKRDGYRVFSASNGEEALEQSLSTQPDLVLLDWVMPGLSGLEVLKLLKKNKETREQSVIMLTACNLVGELEQAFEVGAEKKEKKKTSAIRYLNVFIFNGVRRPNFRFLQPTIIRGRKFFFGILDACIFSSHFHPLLLRFHDHFLCIFLPRLSAPLPK